MPTVRMSAIHVQESADGSQRQFGPTGDYAVDDATADEIIRLRVGNVLDTNGEPVLRQDQLDEINRRREARDQLDAAEEARRKQWELDAETAERSRRNHEAKQARRRQAALDALDKAEGLTPEEREAWERARAAKLDRQHEQHHDRLAAQRAAEQRRAQSAERHEYKQRMREDPEWQRQREADALAQQRQGR